MAGSEEGEVKLYALILGLLAVAGCALLAGEMGGPMAAMLAAHLAIHNPILLDMSTEVRPYSLSALLCVVSLLLAFRMPPESGRGASGRSSVFAALRLAGLRTLAGGSRRGGPVRRGEFGVEEGSGRAPSAEGSR